MSHYFLCSQNKHSKNLRFLLCMVSDFIAAEFQRSLLDKVQMYFEQNPND